MLDNQTLASLKQMKLSGMAAAFADQLQQPELQELSFEERFGLLVDRETCVREDRKVTRLLQLARMAERACVEDINYTHPRGLERSRMATLLTAAWIREQQNLTIVGPTGIGKSWLACAFGNLACRQGLTVRYERATRLFESLRVARADGSYPKRLALLAKTGLLILDDWGIKALSLTERHDLLELMQDRHGKRSTLVASQLPVEHWHDFINDPTVADAVLDRLLHCAHKLHLSGESMRKSKNGGADQ